MTVLGCQRDDNKKALLCDGVEGSYRTKGNALVGDVDGDRKSDRLTLRVAGRARQAAARCS